MHKFLRKNANVIVWIVVFAFVIGGGALGFGTYIGARSNRAPQGQVFASVNGKAVNYTEYQQRVAANSYQLSGAPESQVLGYKYQVLSGMIDRELLLQEANKQKVKVKVTNEDLDQYIEEVKTQYELDDDQLKEALSRQNLTIAMWKEEIRGLLANDKKIEALLEKVASDVTVTEEEIKNEYEEVKISNIFINKMENGLGKERAEEALSKVKGGAGFVEVVQAYSEGGNVEKDGDLGYLKRSEYSPEDTQLAEVAFGLEVNEVSDVIETENGYHIIKVTDKKLAVGEEFEAAKEGVKTTLLEAKKGEVQDKWFQDLKKEAKIVINASHLAGYKALVEQDYDTALAEFQKAAEETPNSDLYLGFVAAVYNALENTEQALATYHQAMEINPTNWQNYYAAARLYKENEQTAEALEMLGKASENAGDEYMGRYQIRAMAQELGSTELVEAQDAALEEIARKIEEQQKADAEAAAAAEEATESVNE